MLPPTTPAPTRCWIQHGADRVQNWAQCLRPRSLAVFLNFSGEAELAWPSGTRQQLRPASMLWLRGPYAGLQARRLPGRERHECLALQFPDDWITATLRDTHTDIPEELRPLVIAPFAPHAAVMWPLIHADKVWAQSFMAPHLCEQARHLLDGARLAEFFLRRIFERPAAALKSVTRTERLARERIERVKAAVLPRLDEPPPLEELAVIAGCATHYLSRTFTRVEGLTFSLWLRRARVEKAATLIATGACNVSEAAVEVGYRSFSHFSRAFFEEKGVQPSRWVEHLTT
jgi:AraC-like DNA-binding protein